MDSGNAAEDSQTEYADYFDDFCEEMAQLLEECGYEELYERNPYDWSFCGHPQQNIRLKASAG